jgi:hypothetical protein
MIIANPFAALAESDSDSDYDEEDVTSQGSESEVRCKQGNE